MSFTFFAKSLAYSWKMSFAGQVLCQRMEIGPCALAIIGKPSAAAPVVAAAAPRRNLRRVTLIGFSPPQVSGEPAILEQSAGAVDSALQDASFWPRLSVGWQPISARNSAKPTT